MTNRYDDYIRDFSEIGLIPYSVLKAFIEIATEANPFYVRVDKRLWEQITPYRPKFEQLYRDHTVNLPLRYIKPTEVELTNLYGCYYGMMAVPYYRLVLEFDYSNYPFTLVTDIKEGMIQGMTLLTKYKKFFPHVPEKIAWCLAAVSYFSDPLKIVKIVDRVKKTHLEDSLKHIDPYRKSVRQAFGKAADFYDDLLMRMFDLQTKYKKQELSYILADRN